MAGEACGPMFLVLSFACTVLKSRMSLGSRQWRRTMHGLVVELVFFGMVVVGTTQRVWRAISSCVNLCICTANGHCSTCGLRVGRVDRMPCCVLEGCVVCMFEASPA